MQNVADVMADWVKLCLADAVATCDELLWNLHTDGIDVFVHDIVCLFNELIYFILEGYFSKTE